MYLAITTKYYTCKSSGAGRISATTEKGIRVSIPYPHECSPGEESHWQAVRALCIKMKWAGQFVCGHLANGSFVFVDIRHADIHTLTQEEVSK